MNPHVTAAVAAAVIPILRGLRRGTRVLVRSLWPLWLFAGGLVVAALVGYTAYAAGKSSGDGIRYAGTTLQLVGLLTVALGLYRIRRRFGRPGFIASMRESLKRILRAFGRAQELRVSATVHASARVSAEAHVRTHLGERAGVEERVAALEKNLARFEEEVGQKFQRLRGEISRQGERVALEKRERAEGDRKLSALVEDLSVGGLVIEVVGLMWLLLGVLGASIPFDILGLLGG